MRPDDPATAAHDFPMNRDSFYEAFNLVRSYFRQHCSDVPGSCGTPVPVELWHELFRKFDSAAHGLHGGRYQPRNPAPFEQEIIRDVSRPPKGKKTMKNNDSDYTAADIIAGWSANDREVRVLRSYAVEIETMWGAEPAPEPSPDRPKLESTTDTGYEPSEAMYAAMVQFLLEDSGIRTAQVSVVLNRALLSQYRDLAIEPSQVVQHILSR